MPFMLQMGLECYNRWRSMWSVLSISRWCWQFV